MVRDSGMQFLAKRVGSLKDSPHLRRPNALTTETDPQAAWKLQSICGIKTCGQIQSFFPNFCCQRSCRVLRSRASNSGGIRYGSPALYRAMLWRISPAVYVFAEFAGAPRPECIVDDRHDCPWRESSRDIPSISLTSSSRRFDTAARLFDATMENRVVSCQPSQ